MDVTVTGAVSHLRDGPGGQVETGTLWVMPCMTRCDVAMTIMTQEQPNRGTGRKITVVLVLLVIVMAFYVGSFLVLRG